VEDIKVPRELNVPLDRTKFEELCNKWIDLNKDVLDKGAKESPTKPTPTLLRLFSDGGMELKYNDVRFTVRRNFEHGGHTIYWMSDWGVIKDWVSEGLVSEKWYPNSMHTTDCIWEGNIPE
jgi:hypothetical protein